MYHNVNVTNYNYILVIFTILVYASNSLLVRHDTGHVVGPRKVGSELSDLFSAEIIFCGHNSTMVDLFLIKVLRATYEAAVGVSLSPNFDGLIPIFGENVVPIQIFFVVSSMDNFLEVIDKIVTLYSSTAAIGDRQHHFFILPLSQATKKISDFDFGNFTELFHNRQIPNYETKLIEKIKRIPQDAQVYLLLQGSIEKMENGGAGLVHLIEMYGIGGRIGVLSPVGTVHQKDILVDIPRIIGSYARRRGNFQNLTINLVAQESLDHFAPFNVSVSPVVTAKFVDGAGFSLLQDYQSLLNFSYSTVAGTGWIGRGKNGLLTGIARQILDGQADMAISASTMLPYRAQQVHFLQPVLMDFPCIFFIQPEVGMTRNIFTMPFTKGTWMAIAGVWLTLTLALCFGSHVVTMGDKNVFQSIHNASPISENFKWSDCFMWPISFVCQQGLSYIPKSPSIRIILLTCWITSFILYGSYTAQLVAGISYPNIPVRSYDDLGKYDIQAFVNPNTFALASTFIRDPNEAKKVKELSHRLLHEGDADDQAVQWVMTPGSKFAFITTSVDGFYPAVSRKRIGEDDVCRVDSLKGGMGSSVKYAMIMRKGSGYKEIFQVNTIFIMERGLNSRYWREFKRKNTPKCLQTPRGPHDMRLPEMFPAFRFILIWYAVASFIGLWERGDWRGWIFHRTLPIMTSHI